MSLISKRTSKWKLCHLSLVETVQATSITGLLHDCPQHTRDISNEETVPNNQAPIWCLALCKINNKKLAEVAKKKNLLVWPSISNHVWCAASSVGYTAFLKDRCLSFLHQIGNKHTWSCMAILNRCERAPLTKSAKGEKIDWMKPWSSAFLHLHRRYLKTRRGWKTWRNWTTFAMPEYSILNCRLSIKSILSEMIFTDEEFKSLSVLENFHSMMTMTCRKCCHFFYDGLKASSQKSAQRTSSNKSRRHFFRWRIVLSLLRFRKMSGKEYWYQMLQPV